MMSDATSLPSTDAETAAAINAGHAGTWAAQMGIHVVRASRDEVVATLTIAPQHLQPYGIVHGGVHCGVIETVASIGAALDSIPRGASVVGLENHTSFVRAVRGGTLSIRATPLTRGRRSQLWQAELRDEKEQLVARGTVRLLVLEAGANVAGEVVGAKGT
jgi:uncharacterized protein (TIGR00369 family)